MEASKQGTMEDATLAFMVGEIMALRAECEDGEPVDVRVQLVDGDAIFHYGDAGYDTDHHGYWGASSVSRDDSDEDCHTIACVMLEEALDAQAEDESAREGSR